jgi:GNAT superfamily N-acetyltransferase
VIVQEATTVTSATLDDWPDVKRLHQQYVKTKATAFIQADLKDLEAYLINSITRPDIIGFLLQRYAEKLVGMVSLQLVFNTQLSVLGLPPKPQTFIHAAYIKSTVRANGDNVPTPSYVGPVLLEAVEHWASERGAEWMFGNVRTDKRNVGFERKYGFELMHQLIGRRIGGNDNG